MENRLQEYLNKRADEYLKLIIEEFGNLSIKNEKGEIISNAEQLILNNIVVVENNDVRLQEQYKKEGIIDETPLAHGGRVFDDGKIHFYPNTLKETPAEEIPYKCESLLIHELFHYFIRPQQINENNNPELKGINSFIDEGIADMYARDFMIKHNIFPKYDSNYGRNVLYVRDLFNTQAINEETRNKIAFNASINDILSMSPYAKDFYTKFCKKEEESKEKDLKDKEKISVKTPFEIYTYNIIENNVLEEDKHQIPSMYRSVINSSANCQSTEHAKVFVETGVHKYFHSKNQTISKPKTRVKTLPTQSNNGYINIVIVISTILICCLILLIIVLLQK